MLLKNYMFVLLPMCSVDGLHMIMGFDALWGNGGGLWGCIYSNKIISTFFIYTTGFLCGAFLYGQGRRGLDIMIGLRYK